MVYRAILTIGDPDTSTDSGSALNSCIRLLSRGTRDWFWLQPLMNASRWYTLFGRTLLCLQWSDRRSPIQCGTNCLFGQRLLWLCRAQALTFVDADGLSTDSSMPIASPVPHAWFSRHTDPFRHETINNGFIARREASYSTISRDLK